MMCRNLLGDQKDKSIQLRENSIPQEDVPSSWILMEANNGQQEFQKEKQLKPKVESSYTYIIEE